MMACYPEYRIINLPWLKKIPVNWKLIRNKQFLVEKKDVVGDLSNQYTLLSLTLRGVIKRDLSKKKGKLPSSFDTYKIISPGDFICCLFDMDETPRTVGLSEYNGMITGAYTVFSVHDINPNFLYYYYLSLDNKKALKVLYTGLRKTIKTDTFLAVKLPLPPRNEQDQIVRFLDWKVSEINKFIAIRRKEIQELRNLKNAIVSHFVIKGLNKYAEMKYSGVNWLGDVPESWRIVKLRQILHSVSEKNHPELPLLSVVREKGVIVRDVDDIESNHNYIPDDLSNYKVVRENQFVINKMKSWQGSYGVSSYTGIVSPAYFIFDIDFPNLEYFQYAIRSKSYVNFFAQASDGIRVGQWDLQMDKMKEIPFLIPPEEEQREIVSAIKRIQPKCDSQIDNIQRGITILHELKNKIISDVVTGKIDVRNITIPEYEHVDDIADEYSEADNDEEEDESTMEEE